MQSTTDINAGANDYGNTSDLRRRYPKDRDGVKDEWKALIRHQTEINEMINKRERELRQLKQDELGQAYDQKRHELIQAKEYELMQKQQEAQMVAARTEQFHQDMQKQQEDKNLLQKHLASHYHQDMNYKNLTEQQKRDQKLEEERRMLEDAKRRMEEAKRRDLAKQEEYYQVFNEEIRRAEAKNNRLLENKIKEKLDYRDAINDNERKQILKEENYKNFFKISNDNQTRLMDLHAQNVVSPQVEKQRQLEGIVDKRINDERERQLQEELRRKRVREDQANAVGQANRDKMAYADYIKSLEKVEKQTQVQQSLRQQSDYQDFLRANKNQKLEQQKHYKDFLDKQYEGQQERDQLNKMTKHEKKLNFGDLQAYKVYDPKLHALLPGFLNSKYDHPVGAADTKAFNGRTSITLDQQNTYESNAPQTYDSSNNYQSPSSQDYSAPKYDAQPVDTQTRPAVASYQQNPSSPTKDRYYETANQFQKYDSSPSSMYASGAAGKVAGMAQTQYSPTNLPRGAHNPITNPLPVNIQNPYINKELNKITQRQPYFANMASNNLIG